MHGLFGTYGKPVAWDLSQYSHLLARSATFGNIQIEQRTLNKFVEDKPFVETECYAYALEGVVFEPTTDLAALYEQYGETFMGQLRGSFSGVFYDKKKDLLLLFNDHVGDKLLFFYQDDLGVAFASDWRVLARALQGRSHLQWNETFAWSMLTYGFSPNQLSPIEGIKRLGVGEYLAVHQQKIEVKTFHRFVNTTCTISLEDAVDRLDVLFRQAVERVLDKNRHYGLDHYMTLSAGLDSRIAVAVARDMSNDPMHAITYSQRGYYDECIPKQIAEQWNCQSHFVALDGGDYLAPIDSITSQTQGLVNYSGPAQVVYGWGNVPHDQCGVVLTGMLGDIVINSRSKKDQAMQPQMAAISQRWLPSVPALDLERFANHEICYLYVRGFNCANLGTPLMVQHYSESYSPFYDVDLLEFCLSLPKSLRYAYRLYDAWILQRYPEVALWNHNGVRPIGYYPKQITLFHRTIPIKELPKRVGWYLCKQLHIYDFYKQQMGQSMNPEDDWLRINPALSQTLQQYYVRNKTQLDFSPKLSHAAEDLFVNGTAMEKFNVLSLLGALRFN